MNISEIISAVAVIISLIALAISIAIYRSTLTRLGVAIAFYKKDTQNFVLNLINESDKSISILGISFKQADKVIVGKFPYYPIQNLHSPTTSADVYLSPYQAQQKVVDINFMNFDISKPIHMQINTSRRNLYYLLDLSNSDNPVVYQHRYYNKHHTYYR